MFWLASLASNLGTWIHEVGASWLMTELVDSPVLVSAVRAAGALPMVLFAIPVGALADRVDRRRLMIVTQCLLLLVASSMATLTLLDRVQPWGLLSLTTLMGLGTVMHVPCWQASTPELVPRRLIPQAVSLGSVSFNLGRSIGPAVGGFLIAMLGSWATFAVNAVSFAGVLTVVILWKRPPQESASERSYWGSLLNGVRFAITNPMLRHVLLQLFVFIVPASVLWSQLPLIARHHLHWDARGYGLMVCGLGVGAVLAAVRIDGLRRRWGTDRFVLLVKFVFACGLLGLALSTSKTISLLLMPPLGACWMMVMTTLNATAQMNLPQSIRARGMACFLTCLALGMSCGSLLWGRLSAMHGLAFSVTVSAMLLLATLVFAPLLSLGTALTDES